MADFLLEFYNEEMPASFLKESVINIKNLIKGRLIKENIKVEKEDYFFTPKRIIIVFLNLKLELNKSNDLIKGPRYDAPEKAIVGFSKSFNTSEHAFITYAKGDILISLFCFNFLILNLSASISVMSAKSCCVT